VSLHDANGNPPPASTDVVVTGLAIRGGRQRGRTDRHGLVAIPTRLPRGAAAMHVGSACAERVATSVDVTIEGDVPRVLHTCAPVAPAALVVPHVARAVVSPGARVDIDLARRPAAAGHPVVVELFARLDDVTSLLDSVIVAPTETRTALTVPPRRVGVLGVRARPLGVPGASEGQGAVEPLLSRPARPFRAALEADRAVYRVGGEARITVRTTPRAERAWVALAVRDLAAHAGEHPFSYTFLDRELDLAVMDPATPDADLLTRAALAASLQPDPAPRLAPPLLDALGRATLDTEDEPEEDPEPDLLRGDLRDPIRAADELGRRGREAYLKYWTAERHLEQYFELIAGLRHGRSNPDLPLD